MRLKKLRKKIRCEICNIDNVMLHDHHVIPQCDSRCTNANNNLAILCPNCHTKIHEGKLIIVGVYQSTDNFSVMWYKNGETPPLPKEFWLIKDNPFVITLNKGQEDMFKNLLIK